MESSELTPEIIANANLTPDLEQRLWTILAGDPRLGPKFHKLLIGNRTAEERLRCIDRYYPNKPGLFKWVERVAGAVYREDPNLAEDFMATLKADSHHTNTEYEPFHYDAVARFPTPRGGLDSGPPRTFERLSTTPGNTQRVIQYTWSTYEYQSHNDSGPAHPDNDPNGNREVRPSYTSSQARQQRQYHDANSEPELIYPPLPELEGDDSFIQDCDDFLLQLRKPLLLPQHEYWPTVSGFTSSKSQIDEFSCIQFEPMSEPEALSGNDRQAVENFRKQQVQRMREMRTAREDRRKMKGIRTRSEDQVERGIDLYSWI